MQTTDWLIGLLASGFIGGGTWLATRWWFERKLERAQAQIEKADKAGKVSAQQTMQARKLVETLQKELVTLQKSLSDKRREPQNRTALAEERFALAEAALAAAGPAAQAGGADTIPSGLSGFADTMPMGDASLR